MVIVPVIPLGEGSADDSARQLDQEHWPGTFALRFTTLRDIAIDLGASIARKGFRNIFLIHNHGAELHNLAFNQAAAFVSEKYQALMVNITSLVFGEGFNSSEILDRHLGEGWQEEIGITVSRRNRRNLNQSLSARPGEAGSTRIWSRLWSRRSPISIVSTNGGKAGKDTGVPPRGPPASWGKI